MVDSQRLPPSKFSPRPLGPNQLQRDRLMGVLEQHAEAKLVLIHAPAGYGKTTLMVQWYEHLNSSAQGTGWVLLDDDDNDAGRLVTGLTMALSPEANGTADLFDSINRCLETHSRFTLFLDEEEHVTAIDALHLLDVMLELSPANLHLVIGSRSQPQKLALRLRMRSDFLEMTAQDLAFRADEIERFVYSRSGITLDAPAKEDLQRRTEGWAVVLQLAAADIARGEPPRNILAHLAAPHSNLFRYLSDEVLIHLQPQQHEFLLQTAFVNELSGPLCDAITGRSDSEAMLLELQKSNLLLQPIDSSRRRFRYHALFADFLRQQLQERHPQWLPMLARRGSDWCARWDTPENAVEYALLTGDVDHLIACIGRCMEDLITRAQFGTAKRWLRAIPTEVLRGRPELLIWTAWVGLYTSEFAAAEAALADLTLISNQPLPLNERLSYSVLRTLLLLLRGRYDEALVTTESAWRETPPVDRRFIVALYNLRGLLRQMRGRLAESLQDTERVLALAAESPPIWLSLAHAAHISAMAEFSLGNLSGAWRQLELPERVLAMSENRADSDANPSQLLALLSGPKALVLYELNRLEDAEDCLERYEPFLNTMYSPSSRTLWYQMRARLLALRGDDSGCLSAIQEGAAYATRHGIAWMEAILHWQRVDYDLARGDINRARAMATELLERTPLDVAPEWIVPCEEVLGPTISALRFLIRAGESQRALNCLQVHLAHSEQQLRRQRLIKLRVLEALGRDALGERDEALGALRQAVGLGALSGAIRSFVDEGPACLALLRDLQRIGELDPGDTAYLSRLRAAFEDAAQPAAAPMHVPLSVRETQILKRLAEGHSNLVVGQQLFLSPNTVKWHLGQIYAKLGVRNRTQAVHVARQYHLTDLP
jgi:LuxR family maltose regulon positive regulatory protein